MEEIFDLLGSDMTAEELFEEVDRREDVYKTQKGAEAERRVGFLLSGLSIVKRIEHSKWYSRRDLRGRDLKVDFDKESLGNCLNREPAIDFVWVQVRSSYTGVQEFRKRYGKTNFDINLNLAEDRMIVINEKSSDGAIQRNFFRRVDFIDRYWKPVE